jgi:hypothetical protein
MKPKLNTFKGPEERLPLLALPPKALILKSDDVFDFNASLCLSVLSISASEM